MTITGTSFDTVPANDKTRFNGGLTTLTSATATAMVAPVPAKRGSGRISIATPLGTAVSTDDFIIPPSPFTPTDVGLADRIPFDTH